MVALVTNRVWFLLNSVGTDSYFLHIFLKETELV